MNAFVFLKKGRVVKRLTIQGRQLIEVSVFVDNQTTELQYSLRRNTLKDKGYSKFSPLQTKNVSSKIEVAKARETKIFGRRVLLP